MTTNEELLTAFNEFKKEMKEEFKDVKAGYVPIAVYQTVVDGINSRIDSTNLRVTSLEGSIAKVVWLVVSTVIGALITVVINPDIIPKRGG